MTSRPFLILWLLGAGLLLATACIGGDDEPSPPAASVSEATPTVQPFETPTIATPMERSTDQATSTATASPSAVVAIATATVEPPATPATSAERSVSYADVRYLVTNVVVSKETPRTYGNSSQEELGQTSYLYVHLSVENELKNVSHIVGYELFQLRDGDVQKSAQWVRSGPPALSLAAGESARYIAGFELPGDSFGAEAALVVWEPGKEPGVVALTGAVGPPVYPEDADIDTRPVLIPADNGCHMTVEPLNAVVDVDAGIDLAGINGDVAGGRRVDTGKRFVRIAVRISSDSNPCNGTTVFPDTFRLLVDGTPVAPANLVSRSIKVGQPQTVVLLFAVPTGTSDLVLRGGANATWQVETDGSGL